MIVKPIIIIIIIIIIITFLGGEGVESWSG